MIQFMSVTDKKEDTSRQRIDSKHGTVPYAMLRSKN